MTKYLTILLLCIAILLCGCEKKQEISEEQLGLSVETLSEEHLELIVNTINEMCERQWEMFDYQTNAKDNFTENGYTFVKYTGKNNSFSDVCKKTKDICSSEVAEKLMQEAGMYSFDGELYLQRKKTFSGYDDTYIKQYDEIKDLSDVTVLKAKNNIVVLSIKRYDIVSKVSSYVLSKYVVELRKDKAYILGYEKIYSYVVNTRNN